MSTEAKPTKGSESMEDIQELLYLKLSRRYKADEANIKRQLEKSDSTYIETQRKYHDLYDKYVRLVQHARTYTLLTEHTPHNKDKLDQALSLAKFLQEIKFDNIHTVIDPNVLHQCKEMLGSVQTNNQLKQLKESIVKKELATKSVQDKCDALQTQVERTVMSALNFYTDNLLDLDLKSTEHNDS